MFTKQFITGLASLALANQATALNMFRAEDKRGLRVHTHVEVVTHWVTVTAYDGQEPAAPTTTSEAFVAPAPEPTPEVAEPEPTPEPVVQEEAAPVEPVAPVEAAPAPAATTSAAAAPVVEDEPVKQVETDNSSSGSSSSGGSTTTSGSKRGLAFNKAELTSAFTSSDKISWAWNWDSSANGLDSNVEYVPTLWGPIDMHTARWNENAEAAIAKGSTHLMSFNECDIASQCNLPASAAADAHVQYLNPFGDKAKIGAPSVSNSNIGGQGLDWLRDWVSACETKGCKYDFCNVHWYSPLNAAETLYSHIKEASKICGGKPIWLTEFAPLGDSGAEASPSESSSWLSGGVLSELDNLAELERYSFFMVADGKLTSGSGLSASGEAYLS
ncbi:glycosyl hydrolase catalytic core-domain-containing protein [Plectosphaerella cucumerina]|jgi:hypothetical protein|uniref:Glycosyl hydrolase catalytic core-domain-containing protein n=1 Tax=Plectosphaerella cucumerina TaxID=40658 RepID=A0A8K0TI59_9PEZI|nr:glycosyl hydrolase catalytic core-domain-containing protein [Plectosphaerella cucumerina]